VESSLREMDVSCEDMAAAAEDRQRWRQVVA